MSLLAILGFIGVCQGLYLIFISWNLAFTLKTKLSLTILMGSHILLLLTIIFYEMDWYAIFPHFLFVRVPIPLLIGPSLYILYRSIFYGDESYNHKTLLHFIPFFIYVVLLSPYYLQETSVKLTGTTPNPYMWGNYFVIERLKMIHVSTYLIWIFIINRKRIRAFKHLHLRPYKRLFSLLLIFYSITVFLGITHGVLLEFGINLVYKIDFIIAVILTLLSYVIGFVFIRYDKEWKKVFKKVAEKKSDIGKQLILELKEFMVEHKIYRNPNLKIEDISIKLGIPRQLLSEIINGELETNFSQFVNRYRIEEFKLKVTDPNLSKLTLLGIAYDVGFNSKTSFQRAFKASTGMTPSAYKKSQIKKGPK